MESKLSETPVIISPSAKQRFYIVGKDRFQNELFAFFLERENAARCAVCEDISYLTSFIDEKLVDQVKIILWDCRGKDLERLLTEIQFFEQQEISNSFMVFFNVREDLGIEERFVWKGIRGFFYEKDPRDLILKGIQAVLKGELWVSREIVSRCILEGKGQKDPSEDKRIVLTPRQVEIIALVAVGASNEEIADKLCISPHTVKTHLYKIFKKIGVPNRLQAALWAAQNLESVIPKYYPSD